jgi:hypothetical protein
MLLETWPDGAEGFYEHDDLLQLRETLSPRVVVLLHRSRATQCSP